jgi:hypothetical protein
VEPREINEVLNRPTSRELLARDIGHLAYVAKEAPPETSRSRSSGTARRS